MGLEIVNVERCYRRGPQEIKAVDQVSLEIEKGSFTALVGSSGAGKSTLLNLVAGLDRPDSGRIEWNSRDLAAMSRRELATYRAGQVGMIFQTFNLIPHYSALKNVELALYFRDETPAERRRRAVEILDRIGLAERMDHRPWDLSGGEQQRVAIARALVKNPQMILADEPTGNLDQDNALAITRLLKELNAEGLTIIMVTHDLELARNTVERIICMQYGRIISDEINSPGGRAS